MKSLLFSVVSLLFQLFVIAQDTANYTRNEIIYARKDGMALTMIQATENQTRRTVFFASFLT